MRIPEERTQALAIPVSTSNIRSIKMDIAAKKEKGEGREIEHLHTQNYLTLSSIISKQIQSVVGLFEMTEMYLIDY